MEPEPKKSRKKALRADYGDATPEDVARAFLRHRSGRRRVREGPKPAKPPEKPNAGT